MRKIYNYLRIAKYKLLSDAQNVFGNPKIIQPVLLKGAGQITFGANVALGVASSPDFYSTYTYIEARNKKSRIIIDENVWTNNHLSIIALDSTILLKKNVLIGWNVCIISSDFHGIRSAERRDSSGGSGDIIIHENAWICSNVTILKGVSIGMNSIIAAGSIVTTDIPPNVVAGGIPAVTLRTLA